MFDLDQLEKIKKFLAEEVMFPSEAAKYLGISPQRLHQLVQSGKINPVKESKAGNLYLKQDLEKRKNEMQQLLSTENIRQMSRFNNDQSIIYEAINYFTVHSLMSYSSKKTKPVYNELSMYIDVSEPFINQLDEVARLLEMDKSRIRSIYDSVVKGFEQLDEDDYVVKTSQDLYPPLLEITEEAPLFLFMRGNPRLLQYPIVSVVGTRNPSEEGKHKAFVLSTLLGKNKIVVASGLAKGIDRSAHEGALSSNNPTIAVIGTPLNKVYPKENSNLQQQIAECGLVISQFAPSSPIQRWNFPARNAVMSGISLATVIVEAGETSGALIQANYAIKQGRLVFIPNSALNDSRLNWPKRYIKKSGAFSFSKIDELLTILQQAEIIPNKNCVKDPVSMTKEADYVYRDI